MPLIEVENLRKTFKIAKRRTGRFGAIRTLLAREYRTVPAVEGVSFELQAGEMVGYIGPNGAGKSTTIKMLTGILYPSAGSATVLGLVPWTQRTTLAMNIATVFGQRSQLWYHLPAGETFDLLAHIYELRPAAYRERRDELVRRFDRLAAARVE